MVRESFCKYIKDLEKDVTNMGQMVIAAINRSIEALKTRNVGEAEHIIEDDMLINKKRWDIEEKCIDLIATQQPVASDLREIIAILAVVTELERIGDYAEGIGKIVVMYGQEPPVKPLIDIPRMAEKAVDMLNKSLDAFLSATPKPQLQFAAKMTMSIYSMSRYIMSFWPICSKTRERFREPLILSGLHTISNELPTA